MLMKCKLVDGRTTEEQEEEQEQALTLRTAINQGQRSRAKVIEMSSLLWFAITHNKLHQYLNTTTTTTTTATTTTTTTVSYTHLTLPTNREV